MALDFPTSPTIGQSFTGPDGTVWTWDGVKWVGGASASGLITAQQIDYDPLRLTAVGTKLKALGPTTSFNNQAAAVNAALDGAMNYNGGSVPCTWNLPAVAPGMVLGIYCGNQTTITPAGSDIIIGGGGPNFTNASPMVIPPTNTNAAIYLVGRALAWDILSLAPKIADVLGWVSRPYLFAQYNGADGSAGTATWAKIVMTSVYDSHGWWDATNHRYTPKRPGRYKVNARALVGDITTAQVSQVYLAVELNGGSWDFMLMSTQSATFLPAKTPMTITTVAPMNGLTDYLETYVYINAPNPWISGGGLAAMTIDYLGP